MITIHFDTFKNLIFVLRCFPKLHSRISKSKRKVEHHVKYHYYLGALSIWGCVGLRVTRGTYGTINERAQVILVWMKALDVGKASHPKILGVKEVRLGALSSLWCLNSKMLKITSIRDVSKKLWDFEWSTA